MSNLKRNLETKIKNMKKNVNEKEGQIDFILYKIKEFKRKKLKMKYLNKKNQTNTLTLEEEEKTDLVENFEKIKKDLQFYFKMKNKPKKKDKKKKDDTIYKYYRAVKTEDIKNICQELRFKLMKKKKSLSEIFEIFKIGTISNKELKIIINLKKISEILKKSPFEISEKNSILLARYFTEDNSIHKIAFKEERFLEFEIFKSILKSLIGEIKIYNKKFIEKEFMRIQDILVKKKTNIIESFTRLMKIRGDFVSVENLKFNFMTNDLVFSNEEFEIILMKLFKEDGNLKSLNYKKLFD